MRPSAPITILETDAATLRYHPRKKIVHHEFRQFVHGAEFRDVLLRGLEVFREHSAHKWLSDDRGNTALKPADAEWATGVWFPQMIAAGWKYWAVVMPDRVIGQMNMKRWIQLYGDEGITAMAFTDPAEALRWLEGHGAF